MVPDLPNPYISHTEPEALIPSRFIRQASDELGRSITAYLAARQGF